MQRAEQDEDEDEEEEQQQQQSLDGAPNTAAKSKLADIKSLAPHLQTMSARRFASSSSSSQRFFSQRKINRAPKEKRGEIGSDAPIYRGRKG